MGANHGVIAYRYHFTSRRTTRQHRVRADVHLLPQLRASADEGVRLDYGRVSDLGARPHHHERSNRELVTEPCSGVNDRTGVDAEMGIVRCHGNVGSLVVVVGSVAGLLD